ncbi:MAG TPA: methionine--tRNA ligase [Acidobacteriota bacterium]|nr:methionine--tRNA ligase [Acidobacteriota bacterium]
MSRRRLLITSALPYANGDIHLGYLLEAVQTDIYARFQRMLGNDAVYVCASDAHGSPIELKARELGKKPSQIAAHYQRRHFSDLKDFNISFDAYHTTDSEETRRHLYAIYEEAKSKGLIYKKDVEGLYSPEDERFLPDRWVRGTCPVCKSEDQYGDSCEKCNSTYRPTDLIDPRSAISGGRVETRTSEHVFYKLSQTQDFLEEWVNRPESMPSTTRAFVREWLQEGLNDWDISRDAPYFGFSIPGEDDKYFYVWLDAPVGYIGATEVYASKAGRSADEFWKDDSSQVVHVIGKDIVYFHCLFWPSVLKTGGYTVPHRVQVHGFLTVNGQKMSKSRGTFINARVYLNHLDPEYLRFFLASKLRPEPSDLDLNIGSWEDPSDPESLDASKSELAERVNSEFVNNLANFSSRVIQFLNKRLDSRLGPLPEEAAEACRRLQQHFKPKIGEAYERFDSAAALRLINELALEANRYFQEQAPWKLIKEDEEKARAVCTMGANYVKALTGFLKPVVPVYAEKVEKALDIGPIGWEDIAYDLSERKVGTFETLVTRIDPEAVKAMVLESRERARASDGGADGESEDRKALDPPLKPEITIDDFLKIDLRVARVLKAEQVEGADKLLRLTIDVGESEPRAIFAGIKKHYQPAQLEGRRIIVVANLRPRKMRFGLSQGMLLAASDGDDVLLLGVDDDASAGSSVG